MFRVPVEGDYQPDGLVLAGVGEGLADDLLVAQVNAVKEPDSQADLAAGRLQLLRGMDDSHDRG